MKARSKELLDPAVAATVAAIEICNKSDFLYREEAFAVIAINGWDQRRLRSLHGMGAVGSGVQPGRRHPLPHDPCVLPGRHVRRMVKPAWEQEVFQLQL